MSISLVEVAGANFRTDYKSDQLNTKFMERLGMRKRFLPARLAIARSLGMVGNIEIPEGEQEMGKVIKGDTLFGTGNSLLIWLSFIVESSQNNNMDLRHLINLVSAHWRRGLIRLDEDWEKSGDDISQFVHRLIMVGEIPTTEKSNVKQDEISNSLVSDIELKVPLGEIGKDIRTGEKKIWVLNGKGGSPHSAIMGGSGSGKTVMAVAMLRAIRQQVTVPLLAFDFKGDLADFKGTKKQTPLSEVFDAKIIEPPRIPVPLDVLTISNRDKIGIDEAALRFRDTLTRLKNTRLGELQRDFAYQATVRALSSNVPCELHNIRDELIAVYDENGIKHDGAIASLNELCRFHLFQSKMTPEEFFKKSWIIKLPPNVPDDNRTIVVNLLLDALDQYLNSLVDSKSSSEGVRQLRIICMIDEAHQILRTKLPSLSRLIRMSRSKGGSVMLVSQSPDDFSGEDDEFLDNMGLVAAFATNAKPGATKRIFGNNANLTKLPTGQCLVRIEKTTNKIEAW